MIFWDSEILRNFQQTLFFWRHFRRHVIFWLGLWLYCWWRSGLVFDLVQVVLLDLGSFVKQLVHWLHIRLLVFSVLLNLFKQYFFLWAQISVFRVYQLLPNFQGLWQLLNLRLQRQTQFLLKLTKLSGYFLETGDQVWDCTHVPNQCIVIGYCTESQIVVLMKKLFDFLRKGWRFLDEVIVRIQKLDFHEPIWILNRLNGLGSRNLIMLLKLPFDRFVISHS
jgi:hypothetical protein